MYVPAPPSVPAALPEPPMPRIPAPYPLVEADGDAAARWEQALALVLPTVGPLDRYGLEVAVPVGWAPGDGDASLAVWVHHDEVVAANTVARTIPKLEAVLSEQAGVPVRVVIERHPRRPGAVE